MGIGFVLLFWTFFFSVTAEQFYRGRRFGWQDLAAVVLLVTLVSGVSLTWFKWFIGRRVG